MLPAAEIMEVDREIGAVQVDLLTNPAKGTATRTRVATATESLCRRVRTGDLVLVRAACVTAIEVEAGDLYLAPDREATVGHTPLLVRAGEDADRGRTREAVVGADPTHAPTLGEEAFEEDGVGPDLDPAPIQGPGVDLSIGEG